MQHGPTPENDGRSDAARAYQWASEIVSVAFVMVGPPLMGWYVSRWLGGPRWQVAWISLGGALGLWLGMRQLLLIAKQPPSSSDSDTHSSQTNTGQTNTGQTNTGQTNTGHTTDGDRLKGQSKGRRRSEL